jgi:phosphoadenosine phosphosulfate reductase
MKLELLTAEERIEWSLSKLEPNFILSSSFGSQSALLLHMALKISPNMKVILLDTQYLFPETYEFIKELQKNLNINLYIYKSKIDKEEQEKKYGILWNKGKKELELYNYLNKVEPMERAIKELNVKTWFSGIRKSQSDIRKEKNIIEDKNTYKKVYPILDWNNKKIHDYLKKNNLPYHPLWKKGYITIGDIHSTKSIHDVDNNSELRFNGINRECGLHL